MANQKSKQEPITPRELLATLPEVKFDPSTSAEERDLAQAELLHSVLLITGLDHVEESRMVREAVKKTLGRVPDAEE